MEKIKLRKIYGTPIQKILLITTVFVFAALTYVGTIIITPESTTSETVSFKVNKKITKETTNIIEKLNFSGTKKNTINLNKNYAEVIYEDNGTEVVHFVDLKQEKEVTYETLLSNKEAFDNKIHELLLNVYPSKIVSILEETTPTYNFREKDLYITYTVPKEKLDTNRKFYLIVDYNEIEKYLDFPVELNETYEVMSGYDYDPNKITVSFTFDDGPNGERTRKLISALEDYKMSATFFMLGSRYESNSTLVKEVYDSHSEVGYHNYEHTYYTTETSTQIINEFNLADSAYNKITGDHITLTRPPYGSYNQTTLDSLTTPLIRWNLDTNDWRYRDVEYIRNYVLENYSDGSIILFHDSYDTSVEAAISLMETLYLMDVQVVNVTELASIQGETMTAHEAYYDFTN